MTIRDNPVFLPNMLNNLPDPEINLLKKVSRFAKKRKVRLYIVGGYLRDILLKRKKDNPDIDFCLPHKAIDFGRTLQKEIKAGFVVLDKEHGACRLVKKSVDRVYTLDFTDLRGKTLEKDLFLRDFTINSLAIELDRFLGLLAKKTKLFSSFDKLLVDPYAGSKDLQLKVVKALNKKTFDDDPLRILRAFSFSSILGFAIDRDTLRLTGIKKKKLPNVSPERIRDEIFKILDSPRAFDCFKQMDKLGILGVVFPEIEVMRGVEQGPYHHLNVLEHSLETVRQFENLVLELKNRKEVKAYLSQVISGERKRAALLKLSCLLHDIGKPAALRHEEGKTKFHGHEAIGRNIAEDIARRLKLSNGETDALRNMVFWHLRPGYLADNEDITKRAIFRYFRDTGLEAVSVLLLSMADQRSTKGPLTSEESRIRHEHACLGLIKEYFRRSKEKKLRRLVNGDDLIRRFKMQPSPLLGKILLQLEESQAIGKIKTKKEALAMAAVLISER